jgi:hypothetical protein
LAEAREGTRRRATIVSQLSSGCELASGRNAVAAKNSARTMSMPAKAAGATPTTLRTCPFRVTERPMIPGSAANTRVHNAWLRTTAGGAEAVPQLSAVKPAPSAGRTWSTSK